MLDSSPEPKCSANMTISGIGRSARAANIAAESCAKSGLGGGILLPLESAFYIYFDFWLLTTVSFQNVIWVSHQILLDARIRPWWCAAIAMMEHLWD